MITKRERPTVDEAKVLIEYHKRIIETTTSEDRLERSRAALLRLRAIVNGPERELES
jgi:hypothetical protein